MLQNKTDNPLDGLHIETYVRADADGVAAWKELLALYPDTAMGDGTPLAEAFAPLATDAAARLEQENRTGEALAAYDVALAEKPDFIPALERKAELLKRLGRADEAAPLLLKLKELPARISPSGDASGHAAPAAAGN